MWKARQPAVTGTTQNVPSGSPATGARIDRRGFLRAGLAVPPGLLVAACWAAPLEVRGVSSRETRQELTPACDDEPTSTIAQTEGPYFTRNSPQRWSLLDDGVNGTRLLLSGVVLTRACVPVAGALLDFWQCDDRGVYDNVGYRLRGHQFTGDDGRYSLETILPGLYPGRTRHIHVKVQAPTGPLLTTQLYFPDEPGNRRDGIFHPALVMALSEEDDGKLGTFDFVVAA